MSGSPPSDGIPDPAAPDGAPGALDQLYALVYGELRGVAHRQLRAERPGHTLCTTALVHEVYVRLAHQREVPWSDRAQFFALAARAMRRILVDHARRHRALRRGGARQPVSLSVLDAAGNGGGDEVRVAASDRADELLALHEALERLSVLDERLGRVVELRFFAGLTEGETAALLGVTPRTVARDWVKAKGWLYQELREMHPDGA